LEVNAPNPFPLTVFELLMVGLAVVLQHTPFSKTSSTPIVKTLPPETAEFVIMEVAWEVGPIVTLLLTPELDCLSFVHENTKNMSSNEYLIGCTLTIVGCLLNF
jgi:hypothetical protein